MRLKAWILKRPVPDHIFSLACILLCSTIYTWPLLSHLRTAIPGEPQLTDVTLYLWSVGWVRFALTHGLSLTSTDYIFVPFGADLRLDAQQLLQAVAAFPFTNILGVVGAFNLILVISFSLNGILAYFFVHSLTRNPQAALIAAVLLMLSGVVAWHFILGRSAIPALWIVIASVWAAKSLLEQPDLRKGLLLGLLLLAASYSDFHTLLFSVISVGAYLIREFMSGRGAFPRPQISTLLLALLVWGIPFGFFYLPELVSARANGYVTPRLPEIAAYSFPLADFADPGKIPYIYGFDFLLIVVAAVIVFRWRGEYRYWLGASLFMLFLSLGPYLQPYTFPLPYAVVSLWPPLMQFRTPYRFTLPALVGLTVVAGYLFSHLLSRVPAAYQRWGIALLLIVGRLWYAQSLYPFETQTYPDYDFYRWVAEVPGDFTIMEVPFGFRTGLEKIGEGGDGLQYYQHIHGKRLLNASVSRLPVAVFEFYRSRPILMFLAGEAAAERDVLDKDFADTLVWSNTRYVVVHRSRLPRDYAERILAFLEEQPRLEFFLTEDDLLVYQVRN